MADISKIKTPDGTTYNIKDNSKLVKTTYEYNTEIAFGSTGKLLIGKFQCYDSNVTITIQSTTNITYYAVAVLATQNINTTGGGTFTWNTYGDTNNTVTPNLYAKYTSGSNWIEIYFSPSSWSKNLIHIQANALVSNPTNICESVSEIPSSATRKPTNTFGTSPKFTDTNNAVTQTATNVGNGPYEILFSGTDDNTTRTEGVRKSSALKFCSYDSGPMLTMSDVNNNGGTTVLTMIGGYPALYMWGPSGGSPIIGLDAVDGNIICNSMNVQDISSLYTFSKTGGHWTYQGIRAVRCGNVVTMQIVIKGGTSVSAGSNGITGTFSGGPLPARINNGTEDMGVQGVNFYGTSALVGNLNSSGTFTLRLLINNQSLGSNTISVTFTFVCD